jgi:hypothetical protein
VAVWPRAAFVVGVAAALILLWLAARILASWGSDPAAALLILAHPTMVLMARTASVDVPFAALVLGTWWCFRNDRWGPTIACCAGLFAIKAIGLMIAATLLGGELLRRLPALRRRERPALQALVTAFVGSALGLVTVVACNQLSTGRSWFGYDFTGIRPFSPGYLGTTAPRHLVHLLLLPPLLVVGAIPFWRRRELGPLAVIFVFGAAMCAYFFVDRGNTWIESLILAPRLLLPVVAFLLVGYADILARLFARRSMKAALRVLLVGVVGTAALSIGIRHQSWQRPAGQAVAAAERIARASGIHELGVLPEAEKAGILFSGATRTADPAHPTGELLLCSGHGSSHRAPLPPGTLSCDLPGYAAVYQADDFAVLKRIDPRSPATGGRSP